MSSSDIQSYSIYIHPQDLKFLRKDIWDEEPVPAKLKFDKKQHHIEIMYRGSHIREFPKKSYEISFVKPKLFFGQTNLHLNAEYIDPSYIRNKLSLDFFHEIGVLSPKSQFISLKINGAYQGLYLQLESVDEYFLRRRGLPEGAIFYAVNDDANFSLYSSIDDDYKIKKTLDAGYERKLGTDRDNGYLNQIIFQINTLSSRDFEKEITNYFDIDKYVRWLAGVVCTQNFDGFIHNYALYINGETKLAEIIPWDYDATWGRDIHGDELPHDFVPITGYNTLTARILSVPTFRKLYRLTLEEVLSEHFTRSNIEPKIKQFHQLIRPYVLRDPYKKNKIEQFDKEPDIILGYLSKRKAYLIDHLHDLD